MTIRIKYTSHLIASSETHTIYDLFVNIMSYANWRATLTELYNIFQTEIGK